MARCRKVIGNGIEEEEIVVFQSYFLHNRELKIIFECLLFGPKNRGLLILLLPDVSPASVAGIPKSKHSNISANRESLNQYIYESLFKRRL